MESLLQIFDTIVASFLTAIRTGNAALAFYGIAVLGVVFVISYAREFGPRLATGIGSLSESLGTPLLFFVMAGGYLYVLTHLIPLTTAALNTAITWGATMSGGTISPEAAQKPSVIMKIGLDVAKPIASFETTWEAIKSTVGLAMRPDLLLVFWMILLAFLATTITFGMTIIEFTLSVSLSYVLLPWGIWHSAASLGEFAVGWVLGGLVRVLVSCAVVGIAIPLFPTLWPADDGFLQIFSILTRLGGTLFFASLAIFVPIKAANWASRAGLALTGSTVMAGAMTFTRFGMMFSGASRGFSQLVGR